MRKNATEFLKDSRIHSVSIGIYKEGESYTGHFGELDIDQNNPPTDRTLYEIASVTKTMTGTLVAKAVLEGKLDLDDDIRKYLDGDYPNLEYNNRPIKIRDVLTHTGGIPGNFPEIAQHYETNDKNDSTFFKVVEIQNRLTKKDFFDLLHSDFLKEEPGSEYNYSNIGPHLLAHILERIYGEKFEDMMHEHVFKEYDLDNAKVLDTEIKPSDHYPRGYNENALKMPHLTADLWYAAGDVKATMPDMINYLSHQVEEKDKIVLESHRELYEQSAGHQIGYFYGIEEADGGKVYMHNGYSSGTQTWFIAYPKFHLGVCIITNTSFPNLYLWGLAMGLVDDLKPFGIRSIGRAIRAKCDQDIGAGIELYYDLKKKSFSEYNFDVEDELNSLGYSYLNDGDVKKAVEIFKLLVSEFPENFNPYDSLGEGYFNLQEYDLAVMNYEKSLALNPENRNALEMIRKIKNFK